MYLFAHALAERAVDELVLADFRKSSETRAHDYGLEVMAVTGDFHMVAL
jgi:hypothetical protein